MNTKKITLTAIFTALVCVATMIIQIPSPTNGYMNLGDTIVLLAAFFLGPYYGAFAGGVGSALSDLISGYGSYVPATFVIKMLMGLCAGLIVKKNKKASFVIIASFVAEVIMMAGYYLFEAILSGSFAAPIVGIPSNICQGVIGMVAGDLLFFLLAKNKYIKSFFFE